ncbi:Uncharacterised protein [Kluyvera cryocrescens]|uniref:Uncharacterized protein n=1 Tax=Kluyvera cryocrescens TaxID=580 RepID=A0A485AUA1_KLUCR|nr:Uncharacterised protein [Kluyvera cryocrescens]
MCLREKKSAQIREILISESAWEEMTCLFAPSLTLRSRCACFFEFPLLFCPSVRKEAKLLPTLNLYIFE